MARKSKAIRVGDGLENLISGMGTDKDKTTGTRFVINVQSQEQQEAAYRGDWIARKIIDLPANDATREWRSWQAEPEQITAIEKLEREMDAQRKVKRGLQKARLYGGAAIIMGVAQGNPNDELILDSVKKGDLKFLHVVSRYEITPGPLQLDLTKPFYGEPNVYRVQPSGQAPLEIHPSRVVRLLGPEVPDITRAENGWGDSVLQIVSDAVKSASTVASAIAALVNEAKVDVISVPELLDKLSTTEGEALLKKRFALANVAKSLFNMLLLDKDEEWQRIVANFANLPETLQMYLLIASGAADIPVTRMLGQSPAGMNSTGESDTRNYFDRISNEQNTELRPVLSRMDEVMIRSALGERPEQIFYDWRSLWQLDETQRTDVEYKKAQIFKIDFDAGVLDPIVLKEARQNQLIEGGMYPGLELIIEENEAAQQTPADLPDPSVTDPPDDENALADRLRLFDATPRTLYVYRPVLNGEAILSHFHKQGIKNTLAASDLHVTIMYSRTPVDWTKIGQAWGQDEKGNLRIAPGGMRMMEKMGPPNDSVTALLFTSSDLAWRHCDIRERCAASWDWPEYQPHITVAKEADISNIEPYKGEIVLGPEVFEEIQTSAKEA